jgi:hypothetical protein
MRLIVESTFGGAGEDDRVFQHPLLELARRQREDGGIAHEHLDEEEG